MHTSIKHHGWLKSMDEISRSRITLLILIGLSYAIVLPLVSFSGMRSDHAVQLPLTAVTAMTAATAACVCTRKGLDLLRSGLEIYVCGFLFILPEGLAVYCAVYLKMPWADAQLSAMDAALGWNWYTLISIVDSKPVLARLLAVAYASFALQLSILPLLLVLAGRTARAYQMVTCSAVMIFIGAAISIWYPAVGTHTHYGYDLGNLKNLDPKAAIQFMGELTAVHDNPNFVFSLARATGIQTFPSMHAAIAVLCGWAAWDVKAIRYPFFVLNIFMGFSAMVVSNHYLVDVIAGVGVAGLSISVILMLVRRPYDHRHQRLRALAL